MANAIYSLAKKAILDGQFAFLTDDIRFLLVNTVSEVFNDADQFVSDITAPVARMTAGLTGKTTTAGAFSAANPTLVAVSGAVVGAAVLYKYNAVDSAAPLIAWIDSSPAIAFTPSGGNVILQLDPSGIFQI